MAKVISKMSVMISGSARGLTNAFKKAGQSTKKFEGVVRMANASIVRLGKSALGAAAGIAGFLGAASGFNFLADALKTAGDMEETVDLLGTVFGKNAKKVHEFVDTMTKGMGRSKLQMTTFATELGSFLDATGFKGTQLLTMVEQLTARVVDLASEGNQLDEDNLERFRAALSGSGEVLQRFGIFLNETTIKAKLLEKGLKKATATPMQIALARYEIIMEGSSRSFNNAANTIGSYTNSMKKLQAQVEDLKLSIGQALLPTVTKLIKQLQKTVDFIHKNGMAMAKATTQVLAFAAGWVSVAVVLPKILVAIPKLIKAIGGMAKAIALLQGVTGVGLLKVVAGLAAGAGLAWVVGKQFDSIADGLQTTTEKADETATAVDKVTKSVKKVAAEAKKAKVDLGFSGGDVGAARAGTRAGFSAVHSGRKQLLRMLQQMKEAQRERKKQTAALNEISQNTAETITIRQANI